MFGSMSRSQIIINKSSKRVCDIVVRSLDFKIFNFENDLSVDALDTDKVNAIKRLVFKVGKMLANCAFIKILNTDFILLTLDVLICFLYDKSSSSSDSVSKGSLLGCNSLGRNVEVSNK